MDREQKKEWVSSFSEVLSDAAAVIVTHYTGLSVTEMTELRSKMNESGAKFKVTKNRLAKLALDGTAYSGLSDLFSGPTAVAYASDPVAAAKALVAFAKENEKLVIIGGAMEDKSLDLTEIQSLAKLPSLDELRGKIVGMINTPATRIAGVVSAPAGQVARVCGAYAQTAE